MTGRPFLVFFCLLGLAAPARADDAPASPPAPQAAPKADAGQEDGREALLARLATAAESLKPGLAATIEADTSHIAANWPHGLPEGVVHADYFPDNVFFDRGRFAGTIDFYFAAVDALAYDVAVALNAWCFEPDGSFNVTAARAFVEGYQRRRRLNGAERAALPLLHHLARQRDGAAHEVLIVHRVDPMLLDLAQPWRSCRRAV